MSSRQPHMLHLTLLNPARHTRIFHKLAWSQVRMGWKVSIAGQDEASEAYTADGIDIIPILPFHRLSWRRAWARVRLLLLALKLRPDAVTIHTPELLGVAKIIRLFTRAEIWYDIHEDYAANIRQGAVYPDWIKGWLAKRVRSREKQARSWLWRISYAEAAYWDILGAFDPSSDDQAVFVLSNLFPAHLASEPDKSAVPDEPYFLYCGTLAREWGVLRAIDWWEHIQERTPCLLVIAGFCTQLRFWEELLSRVRSSPFAERIQLVGGQEYVPYPKIIALIQHCRAGFGLYESCPHLIDKIPTKFYEFLALRKPLIYPETGFWKEFGRKHPLGVGVGVGVGEERTTEDLLEGLRNWTPAADTIPYLWPPEDMLIAGRTDAL